MLAACSILYELLAAQTLSVLAANTVVWYSLTVGVFLASMGVGAVIGGRVARRDDPWRRLLRTELLLTGVGLSIVPLLHLGHMTHSYLDGLGHGTWALAAFFGTALGSVAAVGTLTGIELPLLFRVAEDAAGKDRPVRNVVLGVDYLGSLLGAVLFPLVLLPRMSLFQIGLVAAGENLAVAGCILVFTLRGRPRPHAAWAAGVLGALLVLGGLSVRRVEQYFLRKFYYAAECSGSLADRLAPMGRFPEILRARSPYQRIDLVKDVNPDFMADFMPAWSTKTKEEPDHPRDWVLFLNGDFQTNTTFDEVYHEWFAHVPIVAAGKPPRDVLLLGGGDGLLLKELVKYRGIESILHVDLDPVLTRLARENAVLHAANDGAPTDPRVEEVIGDGYQFVRTTDRTFDAIWIDFPNPVDYDLAKLYSREFFHFVRERLNPGGFAVFDSTGTGILTQGGDGVPQRLIEGNDWPVYRDTLRAAGWGTIVPYLTTLEPDNPRLEKVLKERGAEIPVDPQTLALVQAARTPEEKKAITDAVLRRLSGVHVYMLQQGFIMMSPDESPFRLEWRDPGVPLRVLDGKRFALSFATEYPFPDEVDPALVNSILRPLFPTGSVWEPRRPF